MLIGKCTDVFQGIFLVGGGVDKRGILLGEPSIEEFVMREENFNEGSTGFSSIIKKNNDKINSLNEKKNSTGSKEQH